LKLFKVNVSPTAKHAFKFIWQRAFGFIGSAFAVCAGLLILALILSLTPFNADALMSKNIFIPVGVIGGIPGAVFPKYTDKLGEAVLQHWP